MMNLDKVESDWTELELIDHALSDLSLFYEKAQFHKEYGDIQTFITDEIYISVIPPLMLMENFKFNTSRGIKPIKRGNGQ